MILANIMPIIIVVVVAILGGIAAYFFVRASKGKLELHMPTTGFNSGEKIAGTVTITTKKSLDARRFFVALIGHEEIERRDNSQDGKRTERHEIYRDEYSFLDGEQLQAGMNQSFEFALIAPGKGSVQGGGGGLGSGLGDGFEINVGPLSIGNQRRRLHWKIETRVDLPGVDLAKSKSVRVNVS